MTQTTAVPIPTTGNESTDWRPLLVVCAASFVAVLDFFIVNVALPALQADLGAGDGAIEWVVAGYGLALAVGLVAGGRLGDRHGRRSMFCLGLGLFTLASAACGIAPTGGVLVAARVAQGLAAALLTPQVLAIIGVTYSGTDRTRALGVYGSTMGLAAVSGQLVGGALVSADPVGVGWRACFLINVPIGVLTLLAARRWVAESRVDGAGAPDAVGTTLLATLSLAALVPLVEGRQHGWPWWSWVSCCIAPVLLLLFVAQQRQLRDRGGAPLIDAELLRFPGFAAGLVAQLTLWCGQAAFFFVLALYLQQGRGLGALAAGLVFTFCAVSYVAAAGAAAGLVERFGRLVIVAGGLFLLAGHVALALAVHRVGTGGQVMALAPGLLLVGLGMGLAIPAIMATVLAEVDVERAGSAAGVLTTVQNVGGALGVAITGVVFFGALDGGAAHAFGLGELQLAGVGLLVAALGFTLPGVPAVRDRAAAVEPTLPTAAAVE